MIKIGRVGIILQGRFGKRVAVQILHPDTRLSRICISGKAFGSDPIDYWSSPGNEGSYTSKAFMTFVLETFNSSSRENRHRITREARFSVHYRNRFTTTCFHLFRVKFHAYHYFPRKVRDRNLLSFHSHENSPNR